MKMTMVKKVLWGFSIMLILIGITGVSGIISLRSTNTTWKKVKDYGIELTILSHNFEIDILNARRMEKDFLLKYKDMGIKKAREKYITTSFIAIINSMKKHIVDIDRLLTIVGRKDLLTGTKNITEEISKYADGIITIGNLIEKRGHKDSGLMGELRSAVHSIEEKVAIANLDKITITMLQCRRDEKDFLLRETEEYVTKFKKDIDILHLQIQESTLDSASKTALISLANDYREKFLKVVTITDELHEKISVSGHDMETYAGNLQKEIESLVDTIITKALAIERPATITMAVTVLLAILLAIIIVFTIYKAITKVTALVGGAINQLTSSSNEILASSQQQAAGAREQSAAVSETSSAAKELSQTADQIGESTKRVSEVSAHALTGMAKIKETIDETGKMITSLSEKSQKIGKITELIDDIADQTNLLAVNASIEAARAGEQGKGFTVVADEIRKLADSTAKSTKDITALVEIIQHEMSNAIMSMESSVSSVNEESKLAQESADSAKEISMSSNQQISGSKQIADAMANIDEAMKQIAAGTQQTQVAVKQLTELGHQLNQLTKLLK